MTQSQSSKSKTLSSDINVALREVSSTIRKLGEVYAEEAKALNNIDHKTFIALQEKKLVAARAYQSDMGQMIARKGEIKMADSTAKKRLEKVEKEFSEISRANMDALNRMQRCTERLGTTIRNAAIRAAQRQRGDGYGKTGAFLENAKKKAVSSGLSETV